MVENHHDAYFHMWGQSSNDHDLCIVGKEILSGLILPWELGPKNGIISSY